MFSLPHHRQAGVIGGLRSGVFQDIQDAFHPLQEPAMRDARGPFKIQSDSRVGLAMGYTCADVAD